MTKLQESIHEKALRLAQNFRASETALLDILENVDQEKVFLALGYSSLFEYAVKELKLSDANAYTYTRISRKAQQFPIVKEEIKKGSLSISNAKQIVAVMTNENQHEWIQKAETLSKRELEREIAIVHPEPVRESVRIIAEDIHKLTLGISSEVLQNLRRAQALVSQSERKPASLEQTLSHLLEEFLMRKDPVRKAEHREQKAQLRNQKAQRGKQLAQPGNQKMKPGEQLAQCVEQKADITIAYEKSSKMLGLASRLEFSAMAHGDLAPKSDVASRKLSISPTTTAKEINLSSGASLSIAKTHTRTLPPNTSHPNRAFYTRTPLPAALRHQVFSRDKGRCAFRGRDGKICASTHFVEVHHIRPVSAGGSHSLENLKTLCSRHHSYLHEILEAEMSA